MDVSLSTGRPFNLISELTDVHGTVIFGTHGCGAFAAATWGLEGERHMPKGAIFVRGTKSCSVAT